MSANGQLTASELAPIGNGMFLLTATAHAWGRMSAACKAATGVTMRITPPYGAYRDLTAQQYMIDHPVGPVPIAPLGHSTHGDGRALDVSNFSLVYNWLKAHAHEFGFTQTFKVEPWHWRHDGTTAAGGGGTPITERRHNTMSTLYHKQNSTPTLYALAGDSPGTPANWLETTAQGLANAWSAQIGGPSAAVNDQTWEAYKAAYRAPLTVAGGISSGVSKADVDAAADRVIAQVPTAGQNGAASRAAMIKD